MPGFVGGLSNKRAESSYYCDSTKFDSLSVVYFDQLLGDCTPESSSKYIFSAFLNIFQAGFQILTVNKFFSRIRHEDILFTDWLAQNNPESLQLSGVEEVKARIGEYLLKYKIFGKHEKAELQNCLNKQWGN